MFELLGVLSACDQQAPSAGSRNIEQNDSPEFKGKIAKSYEDSEVWWPPEKLPKNNAPKVIFFLLDDVGFAQVIVFIKTKEFGGTGELYVNDNKVDEIDMPHMHIATYSLAETFDIGRDTGTQVSKHYTDPFPFKGDLDRVLIRLTD